MSTGREKSFACALVTGAVEKTVYVRAWNARMAGEVLLESLLASGIRDTGTIVVRDAKGREAWRAAYPPVARGLEEGQGGRA
jgi:hypothetical protein